MKALWKYLTDTRELDAFGWYCMIGSAACFGYAFYCVMRQFS